MSVPRYKLVWKEIHLAAISRISKRFQQIHRLQPTGVPRLIAYGFRHDPATCQVFLKMEFVEGRPLQSGDDAIRLKEVVPRILNEWRQAGFVHGDLSPRNILLSASDDRFLFIDWILDLASYEGTPLFAASQVFQGKHDFESDSYAIDKVLLHFLK